MKLKNVKKRISNYPIKTSTVAAATFCAIGLSGCTNSSQIKEPKYSPGISGPVVGHVYTKTTKGKK